MSSKFDFFEKQKFLYFRSATSLSDDRITESGDANDDTYGSVCIPVKNIVAFYPGNQLAVSDNKLTIAFKSVNRIMSDSTDGNTIVHDMIVLDIEQPNSQKEVITRLSRLIADPNREDFIVVADVLKNEFIEGVTGVNIFIADKFA